MKLSLARSRAAFTFVEIMVTTAVATIVLAGLALGAVALQSSFAAVEVTGSSQSDQSRALDYIARDVRRAASVAVVASPPSLTLTAQTYINPGTGQPNNPTLSGGVVSYGGSTTIVYTLSGNNLIREESGNRLIVARSVTAFTPVLCPTSEDPLQKTVTVALSYASPLKWRGTSSSSSTTTTTQIKATARK